MWESADAIVFWLTLVYAAAVAGNLVVQGLSGKGFGIVVPNWLPLLLVLGLLAKLAATGVPASVAAQHLAIGAGLFCLSFGLFAKGMISGGFGKLISAALAFPGPAYLAETSAFVAAAVLLGSVTGILILKVTGRTSG